MGAFQPILRFHSDHASRLPWQFGTRAQAEDILRLRHSLIPYIYTLSYQASTTGIPLMRGLYLYYPEISEAYSFEKEYFWGDQLLVHPVATKGLSVVMSIWFPPGTWTHWFTGVIYKGPSVEKVISTMDDMPLFAKAGAIVPMQPYMDFDGQLPVDPLIIQVFPGADGLFVLYEDEGENFNFRQGKFGLTNLVFSNSNRSLLVSARQGSFMNALSQRAYSVRFINVSNPKTVTINGASLNRVNPGNVGFWYNTTTNSLYVESSSYSVLSDVKIIYG